MKQNKTSDNEIPKKKGKSHKTSCQLRITDNHIRNDEFLEVNGISTF